MQTRKSSSKNLRLRILLNETGNNENTVKGTLEIESKADISIHGILLTVHGEVSTEITSSSGVNSTNRKYYSRVFVQSTYILGNGSGTIVLSQGKRSLSFIFNLPPHLPSSFEGTYGVIKYMITAQVHSDNERNDDSIKISHPLQVQRFLDLSDGLAYGNTISYPSSLEIPQKTLRTTFAPNQNQLKFVFKIQKTGFATGESIPFVLDLHNPERKKLTSMSVTLDKKTDFADFKDSVSTLDELAKVSTVSIDNLKSTLTWIGSLHVPQDIICSHSVVAAAPKKKPIFSHQYLLRVQLVAASGSVTTGEMPIIIGTTKYECRSRRQIDHCCRTFSAVNSRDNNMERQPIMRRQTSVPPSYSQAMFNAERRQSLETLPPHYEEVIAMASRAIAKETRHLMG